MIRSITTGSGSSVRPESDSMPFVPGPLEVSHVVVPLDGSPFAERALPVADWVAAHLSADVHLVEVVPSEEDGDSAEGAIRYLDGVARRQRAAAWDVVHGDDVAEALADAVTWSPGRMVCMATHGRDRAAAPLGSVAASLLDHSDRPVVVVGPTARPVTAVDAPVVAAVDGTDRDDALVPVALSWAEQLALRLEVLTVAEPAPREDVTEGRAWGPANPDSYVAGLIARCRDPGVDVGSHVVYDPISVHAGLLPRLDEGAALVVLGSQPLRGGARTALGSHAAHIVHDAPVPALAVRLSPEA
jgi:nucleotide-binding universal stress UspA family protein